MRSIATVLILLIASFTGGCGSGGGGDGSSGPVVTGTAAKGRFVSGFARAYAIDLRPDNPSRPRGEPLGERTPLSVTPSSSRFELSLPAGTRGPILVEVDGEYLDEARGNTAVIPPENPLRGAAVVGDGDAIVNVTALNHLALSEALRLAGGREEAFGLSLETANARIARQFGLRPGDLASREEQDVTSRALRAIATAGRDWSGGPDSAFLAVRQLSLALSGQLSPADGDASSSGPGRLFTDIGSLLAPWLPAVLRVSGVTVEPTVVGRGGSVDVKIEVVNYGGMAATLTGLTMGSSPQVLSLALTTPLAEGGLLFSPFESPRVFTFRGVVPADAATSPVALAVRLQAVAADGTDASEDDSWAATLSVVGVPQRDLPALSFGAVTPSTDLVRAGETASVTVEMTNRGGAPVDVSSVNVRVLGSVRSLPPGAEVAVAATSSSVSGELVGRLRRSLQLAPGEGDLAVVDLDVPSTTRGFEIGSIALGFPARDTVSGITLEFTTPYQYFRIQPQPARLSISSVRLSTATVESPGGLTLEVETRNLGGSAIVGLHLLVQADRAGVEAVPVWWPIVFAEPAGNGSDPGGATTVLVASTDATGPGRPVPGAPSGVSGWVDRIDEGPRLSTTEVWVEPNVAPGPVRLAIVARGYDEFTGEAVDATPASSPEFAVVPSRPRAVLRVDSVTPPAAQVLPGTGGVPVRLVLVNDGPVAADRLVLSGSAFALSRWPGGHDGAPPVPAGGGPLGAIPGFVGGAGIPDGIEYMPYLGRELTVRPSPANPATLSPLSSGVLELLVDVPADLDRSNVVVRPRASYFDGVEAQSLPREQLGRLGEPLPAIHLPNDAQATFRVNPAALAPPARLSILSLTLSTGTLVSGSSGAVARAEVRNDGGQAAVELQPEVPAPLYAFQSGEGPWSNVAAGQTVTLEMDLQAWGVETESATTLRLGLSYDDGVSNENALAGPETVPVTLLPGPFDRVLPLGGVGHGSKSGRDRSR